MRSDVRRLGALAPILPLFAACSQGSSAPAGPASSQAPAVAASPAPPPPSAAPPPASAAAPASAEVAPPPAASASAPAAPAVPVKVKNIGIHIGGGPNDAPTKAPIKASVDPHNDAFGLCFAKLEPEARRKPVDLSTDVLVPKAGGKGQVKKVKVVAKGSVTEFEACVRRVWDALEWKKPKGGDTMVSYSLRFTPE